MHLFETHLCETRFIARLYAIVIQITSELSNFNPLIK